MNPSDSIDQPRRIAFISTRIQGTDGVSLEIGKWADELDIEHVQMYELIKP